MSEENDFTVTVDGVDHKYSELNDGAKQLVNHVRDLDGQIEQLNYRFEQLNASKTFFSNQLVASLQAPAEASEEAPAEASEEAPAEASEEASAEASA